MKKQSLIKSINQKIRESTCGEFDLWDIIFISILFTFMMFLCYTNTNNQDYKITKTECHNETVFNFTMVDKGNEIYLEISNIEDKYFEIGCDILEKYNALDKSPECKSMREIVNNLTKEFQFYTSYRNNQITKEVCNPVEFENVTICKQVDINTGCTKSDNSIKFCVAHGDLIKNITYNCCEIFNKKDLTKEWLDKNCECLDLCWKEPLNMYFKSLNIFIPKSFTRSDYCIGYIIFAPEEGYYCKKYKCSDYSVEVI